MAGPAPAPPSVLCQGHKTLMPGQFICPEQISKLGSPQALGLWGLLHGHHHRGPGVTKRYIKPEHSQGCSGLFMAMEETSDPPMAGPAPAPPSVLCQGHKTLMPGQFICPEQISKLGSPQALGLWGLLHGHHHRGPGLIEYLRKTGALARVLRFFVVIWQCPSGDVTKYFVDRLPPDHRSWGWGGPFFPWATRCCGMKISFFTERKTVYFFRKALTFYQNACMITTVTICNLFVSGCYQSDTDRIQTD